MRNLARRTGLALALLLATSGAIGQEFPNRPIRLVVPITPGAGADLTARIIAPEMSKLLGQPVVVENKPGAGHTVAYEYLAKQAPADGYTIGIVSVNIQATLPVTAKGLRFDPIKDFVPIVGLAEGRYFFGSASRLPWRSFGELIAMAKASPGKLNYGSTAPIVRLQSEALAKGSGIVLTHVPYSSAAAYLAALASGEIQIGFMTGVYSYVRDPDGNMIELVQGPLWD